MELGTLSKIEPHSATATDTTDEEPAVRSEIDESSDLSTVIKRLALLEGRLAERDAQLETTASAIQTLEATVVRQLSTLRLTTGILAAHNMEEELESIGAFEDIPVLGPIISEIVGGFSAYLVSRPVLGSVWERQFYHVLVVIALILAFWTGLDKVMGLFVETEVVSSFKISAEEPFGMPRFRTCTDLMASNMPMFAFVDWSYVFLDSAMEWQTAADVTHDVNGQQYESFYQTSTQPDINIVKESGRWMNATWTSYVSFDLRDDGIYKSFVSAALQDMFGGGFAGNAEYSMCAEPQLDGWGPSSVQDFIGTYSGFAPAFYLPYPNVTRAQFDYFVAAMAYQGKDMTNLAGMSYPYAAYNFSQWQTWQAGAVDGITGTDYFGTTFGEVLHYLLSNYIPLVKQSIALENPKTGEIDDDSALFYMDAIAQSRIAFSKSYTRKRRAMQYGWPWPFNFVDVEDAKPPYTASFDASVNSGPWTGGFDQPSYRCNSGDLMPDGEGFFPNYPGFAKCEYLITTSQFYQPASILVTHIDTVVQRESSFAEVCAGRDLKW